MDNNFTINDLESKLLPKECLIFGQYMRNKTTNQPGAILDFLEKNLANCKEIIKTVDKIRENPEIINVLLGELNAAIYKFNRMKNESVMKNSEQLIGILGQVDLPEGSEVFANIANNDSKNNKKKIIKLFQEMQKFRFIDVPASEEKMMGRILLALYRTFLLQKTPSLREKGAQIASSLEEMLAILALKGFDTHLFRATRHWIADWQREGFSKELADKISKIKDKNVKLN